MKKFFKWFAVAFLVLCCFFSCTQVRKNTIVGQIEGLDPGDSVVLASWHASQQKWVADENVAVKKPGQFTIKTADKNEMLRLFIVPAGDTVDVSDTRAPHLKLFAEGLGKYTVKGTVQDFPNAHIQGGVYDYPEVRRIDSLNILQRGLREEYASLDRADTAGISGFRQRWDAVADSILLAQRAIAGKYSDHHFASWVLADLGFSSDAQEIEWIDSLYQALSEKVKKGLYGRNVKKRVDYVRGSAVGAQAPDFALVSLEGDTLRLADFRGGWTVLDFWASWCGPCRRANPHMVSLYRKYHPVGLEVLGVAVWDQDAAWREAVAQDALPWANVRDREGTKDLDEVSQIYAVNAVPTTLLIDPQGKIVYRGHPMNIDSALAEAFAKVE